MCFRTAVFCAAARPSPDGGGGERRPVGVRDRGRSCTAHPLDAPGCTGHRPDQGQGMAALLIIFLKLKTINFACPGLLKNNAYL